MTEQQMLLRGEGFCKQCILLPHDIMASLFEYPEVFHAIITGEPGRIDEYWAQNLDLLESLGMPELDPWLIEVGFLIYLGKLTTNILFLLLVWSWHDLRIQDSVCHSDCTGTALMPPSILS